MRTNTDLTEIINSIYCIKCGDYVFKGCYLEKIKMELLEKDLNSNEEESLQM